MPLPLPGFIRRSHPTEIAYVAPAVGLGVGIYDFTVITGFGCTDVITVTNYRRGVYDKDNNFALARLPHPSDDAVFGVVKIEPFESFGSIVQVPQGRLALI